MGKKGIFSTIGVRKTNRNLTILLSVSLFLALILLAGATPLLASSAERENYKKVVRPFSTMEEKNVHTIPKGSIVKYLANGTTEVTGPKGKLLLSIKDNEVAMIATPTGPKKATHVFQHPSGSFVHGASENVVEVYGPDNKLILTIIDKSGKKVSAEGEEIQIPAFSGWIEAARSWFGGAEDISYFYAEWYAPKTPINNWIDDDVTFLFPGIQGDGRGAWSGKWVIVQPVLQHNNDGYGGLWPGNPLDMRSWVAGDGSGHYSSPVSVSEGDSLAGAMTWDYQNNRWIIYSWNTTTSKGTSLVTDLMSGGDEVVTTLEGYNLETNSDLFGDVLFSNMEFWKRDYVYGGSDVITVSWHDWYHQDAGNYFTGLDVNWFGSSYTVLYTDR